jgi:hypothetical protein
MVDEQALKNILCFGFLGYWRKPGKYYFKPYSKYLHHFDGKTIFQNPDLGTLTKKITDVLTVGEVS